MQFRIALVGAVLAGSASAASAATFDLARSPDGSVVPGLRVEGEIVPGDAQRMLDAYANYGTAISPVYLRSKGGDVEEAMRMGTIIRRLRLETSVPVWITGRPPVDSIKVDHQEDTICASACFLVYAGGAVRFGNYLALHRPYLARKDAQKLTDIEYEAFQKTFTPEVKAYLADMDVDQYWIDRMFASNSQEAYMPTWDEATNKLWHLMGMVPSLEEVVLSKCKEDPDEDEKIGAFLDTRSGPVTPTDIAKMNDITHESDVFDECRKTVFSGMQSAALERENEPALAAKCGSMPTSSEVAEVLGIRNCRTDLGLKIQNGAFQRWYQEAQQSLPKPAVAEDFDTKGLTAAEMVKLGQDAYKAERWDVAARWFHKAADLGDADGMMKMSWIYGNGKGVPQDEAKALSWVRMAADHGSTVAMESLAFDDENGEDGINQDYVEAMRWYRKAADLGDATAMMEVGVMYNVGYGVAVDYAEAMKWFRKAADAGSGFAMEQIGVMYEFGHGVPEDEEQVRQWMEKAALSNDDIGKIVANEWLVDHPAP